MSKPAASPDVAVIASALALPVDGGAPAKRFRIVPFGTFGGRDGRGPWQLRDKAHAEQVIAATKAFLNGVDMVVNYDHQTEYAAVPTVGGTAKAAGWINPDTLEVGADGIYAEADWTPAAEAWFLIDASQALKPIILQTRQEPTFTMIVDPQSEHVFKTGEFLMGAEARAAAGYTFWQLAHRCTGPINEANYVAACQAMEAITDDEGEPLGIKPTHIIVGTSNKSAARNLFKKMNLAGGESNIYFEDVEILEARRLP